MDNKKPALTIQGQSVISIVTQLHSYFRDLQSYYQIIQGQIASELESVNDPAKLLEIKQNLKDVNQKLEYFHVLNNAISSADVILHTEAMIEEFKIAENKNNIS